MAITLAEAFGTVVLSQSDAAALFGKFSEMLRDWSPTLETAFNNAAENVLDYPDDSVKTSTTTSGTSSTKS